MDSWSSSSNASFIIRSMEQKSLLITGSTGFLAKVFMEKVLRVQPQVKKIYLLLRAEDNKSATHRFQQEVIGKDVFNVLRKIHGSKGFDTLISSKVVCLTGDISLDNLGITDSKLEQEMLIEINFIVNVAASCDLFDERYDVALRINTLGVKHVFEFAKKCQNLESFLHVSTAYVTREREGRILEKLPYAFRKGNTFSESSAIQDIQQELKIVEERLKQLIEEEASDKTTTISMKTLGLERARFHGWVNTYVFTKAMGEFLLAQLKKENYAIPIVILRPSVITCTYKQPFPGWNERFKSIDAVMHTYGKGELTHFVADTDCIVDVIPGDMVVNAMVVALAAATAAHQDDIIIYHLGSSTRNPMKIHDLMSWASDYYSMNPLLDLNGKHIRISRWTPLASMAEYSEFVRKHYKLPLEAFPVGNVLFQNKSFQDLYNKLNKQYTTLMWLVELFGPFSLFKGRFDNSNSEKLRATIEEEGLKELGFDTKGIDWEDYFKNVHLPGRTKYAITESRLLATSSRL